MIISILSRSVHFISGRLESFIQLFDGLTLIMFNFRFFFYIASSDIFSHIYILFVICLDAHLLFVYIMYMNMQLTPSELTECLLRSY